jgi:DNA-binding NtrC family response regulator
LSDAPKKRLLIVDDENDLTNLLSEILGAEGYEISTARDGDEALAILGKETFDAVLLDILMPNRNGFEVLKHLTEHHPSTKTIMLTAYSDLASAVETKRLGAVEFITKPYKLQTVLSTLQRVLGQ